MSRIRKRRRCADRSEGKDGGTTVRRERSGGVVKDREGKEMCDDK